MVNYSVKKNKEGKYGVYKAGASRASRVFDSLQEANAYAAKVEENSNKIENIASKTSKTVNTFSKVSGKKISRKKKKIISFLLACLVVLFLGIGGYFTTDGFTKMPFEKVAVQEGIVDGDLQIHFLELGNKYTGDSTYIKAGDMDILIDAGSRNASAGTIKNYVDQYCSDQKLEFVIATHAHQDHIAGFVGTSNVPGIFDSYQIDTLIDFGLTDSTTSLYSSYITKREALVANGTKYYTQNQCYKELDGAKKVYQLSDTISMHILYNYYGEFNETNDENNFSVCVMFTQKENKYLFTGDLEKEGESRLVDNNKDILGHVALFKGGHHGSYTASTSKLLDVITPQICCVCCCAGSTEYTSNLSNTFPAQDFINRIAVYTDKVYVTSLASNDEKGYTSFNGNIIISSYGEAVNVACSHNTTILKDTEWFKENRTWPLNN